MWKLKGTIKDHWEHFVFVEDECIVGRKDSSLLISNDPSVSRKHATLFVRHPVENLGYPLKKATLFLRDESSKYGTFKNGVKITNEEELADGDVVKFGQFESEFRIHYVPLIVTTSCLDVVSKNKLKKLIHNLGGHLVSEWQPTCTHLVMSQIKVTIKALCCLVSLKYIVLPEYFEELEKKLKSSATIIPPNEYIPPIGESLIDKERVSFDVDPQRKDIFKDKTFFFMDEKQFKKLHLGIMMGGGRASILSEDKTVDTDVLLNENSCFIEPVKGQIVKEESKNFLKGIISTLQRKNLRMIPESDVGLAVAYSSTEQFCNPSFNVGSVVLGSQKIPSQTLTEREVYVPDTQEHAERPTTSKISSLLSSDSQQKSKRQKLEAPDSFNLTSFGGDVEDIFEIPLSAQVKQELDDIFDITMKTVNDGVQNEQPTLPSTLPLELDPPDEEKITRPKEMEKTLKRPKIKKEISLVNGNASASVMDDVDSEANLPRNLISIKFAPLIVRKPNVSREEQINSFHVRNFKKFKKVFPRKAQALPRIIGGHDLAPYDKDAAKFIGENWDDDVQVMNDKPVKGAFDWDTPLG